MKFITHIITIIALSLSLHTFGQSNFPFSSGDSGYSSFFISPTVQLYRMNEVTRTSVRMDIGLGVSKFIIGGYFDSFIKEINIKMGELDEHMTSTGLFLGYVNDFFKSFDQIFKIRIGPGNGDKIFIISPELGFEICLIKYLKIGFLASYQQAYNLKNLPDFQRSNFAGFGGGINFKVGFFKGKN